MIEPGSVVRGLFPYSGEPGAKSRPCIVLARWPLASGSYDVLVCMLSTQIPRDAYALELSRADDFAWFEGPPVIRMFVRPTYLFSGAEEDFRDVRGRLTDETFDRVKGALRAILQ